MDAAPYERQAVGWGNNQRPGQAPGASILGSESVPFLGLESRRDLSEHVRNLETEGRQDADAHNGDQEDDQRVLNEALAFSLFVDREQCLDVLDHFGDFLSRKRSANRPVSPVPCPCGLSHTPCPVSFDVSVVVLRRGGLYHPTGASEIGTPVLPSGRLSPHGKTTGGPAYRPAADNGGMTAG